jgi:predicted ATPase
VGKTRLTLKIASQIALTFKKEVAFVPLEDISAPQDIPRAILNASGFSLFGPQTPLVQLCDFLREKHYILILDNFEHLIEGVSLIREILDRAPQVKVLVTSREKLNLQGEWVYPIEGLQESQACQLFVQTARRLVLNQNFQEEENYILQISRLVDGVPLAIELAASWVRVLTCQEIVEALKSNQATDILTSTLKDIPIRHRSLLAVFEHSWDQLREREKQVLMNLSVFRGGFHREAAKIVAGAELTDLTILVDKSLLHRRLNGRYELHGLIRMFASEKMLLSKAGNNIRKKHAQYYSQLLVAHEESLQELLSMMRSNYDNIRAVWMWAVSHHEISTIEILHTKIYMYFEVQGAFLEGIDLFRKTIEVLTGEKDPANLSLTVDDLLPWKLLAEWSALTCRLGHLEVARSTFSRCVEVFRRHGYQAELAFSLFYLGDTTRLLGDYSQAKKFIEKSLDLYLEIGKQSDIAFALNILGLIYAAEGEPIKAKTLLEESRNTFLEIEHVWGLAIANINLGSLLKTSKQYGSATSILQESLLLCQQLGHRWAAAVCLNHLGEIAQLQGDFESAQGFFFQSFLLYKEIGFSQGMLDVIPRLASLLQRSKNFKLALALLLKANRDYQKVERQEIQKDIALIKEKLSFTEYQEAEKISAHKSFEAIMEM